MQGRIDAERHRSGSRYRLAIDPVWLAVSRAMTREGLAVKAMIAKEYNPVLWEEDVPDTYEGEMVRALIDDLLHEGEADA